eukprot:TRINITY_DN13405_c0_g1_i1.p1 TRINITY_DN13405_c0_g1~~TRINITY_DN13405_c0_g1_i1.p1  ORF type:complete len:305 (+),score=51.20 TRINITY_DN13405_c0_g1_i1:2-916(+)
MGWEKRKKDFFFLPPPPFTKKNKSKIRKMTTPGKKKVYMVVDGGLYMQQTGGEDQGRELWQKWGENCLEIEKNFESKIHHTTIVDVNPADEVAVVLREQSEIVHMEASYRRAISSFYMSVKTQLGASRTKFQYVRTHSDASLDTDRTVTSLYHRAGALQHRVDTAVATAATRYVLTVKEPFHLVVLSRLESDFSCLFEFLDRNSHVTASLLVIGPDGCLSFTPLEPPTIPSFPSQLNLRMLAATPSFISSVSSYKPSLGNADLVRYQTALRHKARAAMVKAGQSTPEDIVKERIGRKRKNDAED